MEQTVEAKVDNKTETQFSQSAVTVVPSDLLKPPPLLLLLIEKMTSGARKFVVLDFGVPILLTDLIIPSTAEVASVTVDVWLLGESIDGQRLLYSSEISKKNVVLQDIAPFMLIRYLKLTYTGCHMFSPTCRIPLGMFFGHRFFCSWQQYAFPVLLSQFPSCPALSSSQDSQSISLVHLQQFSEDLRCRHQLASAELKQLVRIRSDEKEVFYLYNECLQLRIQWNIVRGVVNRLEYDQMINKGYDEPLQKSWKECCSDQLRIIAEELFALLRQCYSLLDVRYYSDASSSKFVPEAVIETITKKKENSTALNVPSLVDIRSLPQFLDLHGALRIFDLFCTQTVPKLRAECASWLLVQGVEMDWWPKFFPNVLKKFFSASGKRGDQGLAIFENLGLKSLFYG
ncbi:unnamed protein product [Dracunculus medinensis]|uniref:DUF4509 domain-containing protein n=1 Tax=Dracunculus medinensis TaxID=318479 RepID=A0A0N4U8P6_DRAME|nr:unnamed protein product [Dracunculus medinensis]